MTRGLRQGFGRYTALDSPLHALDPTAKLVVFCLLLADVLVCNSWLMIAAASSYMAVLLGISRVHVRFYLAGLKSFSWMLALAFAVNLLFPNGEGVQRLTYAALNVAGIFSVRLALMILAATLLTVVTSPSEIGDGLLHFARLKGRLGRRAAEFALIVSIALRFVPIMFEEAERIRAAQMLRGRRVRGLANRVKALVGLIIPLLDSAMRRSVSLAYALEARCYGYGLPARPGLRVSSAEVILGCSAVGVLVGLIWMR